MGDPELLLGILVAYSFGISSRPVRLASRLRLKSVVALGDRRK